MSHFSDFSSKVLAWHRDNPRPMPWSNLSDPYLIWISEIILQQTRVEQGWDYYIQFTERYPTVKKLASATEEQVLKSWEGLGYYSRARNLLKAAKLIVDKHKGQFPRTYDSIIALPGVGSYTAAAISSFAYNDNIPVIDGNVNRVISRYFGVNNPVDRAVGKIEIETISQQCVKGTNASEYNQAIINFGAIQCGKSPLCNLCPLVDTCYAYTNDKVKVLPSKSKKIKKRDRYFHFFDIRTATGSYVIMRRTDKDIWQGLYQFPLYESKSDKLDSEEISAILIEHIGNIEKVKAELKFEKKHLLTHQNIYAKIYKVELAKSMHIKKPYIEVLSLKEYAFPKLLDLYLQTNLKQ